MHVTFFRKIDCCCIVGMSFVVMNSCDLLGYKKTFHTVKASTNKKESSARIDASIHVGSSLYQEHFLCVYHHCIPPISLAELREHLLVHAYFLISLTVPIMLTVLC